MSHAHTGEAHKPHVLPIKVYLGVWAALMVLTVVTVAVSYVDLGGKLNIIVAMVIATVKISLVCLYFMHLKYDDRFNSAIILAAFGFLSLLFIFTLADFDLRGAVDPLEKGTITPLPESSIYDPDAQHGEGHQGEAGHEEAAPDEEGTGQESGSDSGGH